MLVWAHGGLLAARNIPIFMIVAAPPVAAAIQHALRARAGTGRSPPGCAARPRGSTAWRRKPAETEAIAPLAPGERGSALALVAALICRAASAQEVPRGVRSERLSRRRRWRRCGAIRRRAIFTHDEWGDYLIWSLYPEHRVFVDGRSDFYGDDFEEKYIDVLNVKYGWEKTLSRLRRRHDFNAPRRAADRRVEGIQPLARRLRRWHRAGVPVRTDGPRANRFPPPNMAAEQAVIARSRKPRRVIERSPTTKPQNLGANDNDVFAQFLE